MKEYKDIKKSKFSIYAGVFFLLVLFLTVSLIVLATAYTAQRINSEVADTAVLNPFSGYEPLPVPSATMDTRAQISFSCNGHKELYIDDIIEAPDHLIAEEIHARKINAPLDEKLRMVERCLNAGATHKDALLYCFPLLEKTVIRLANKVDTAPVDSTIKFNPDKTPMFSISREKIGYELEQDKLYQSIYLALRTKANSNINVIPKVLNPEVTTYDHIKTTHLRARFSTSYEQSNENRRHNIRLALSRINGTVLAKGEEFSFNKAVGQRTIKNGFKEATIILRGEYTEGIGGGVCQASTTVYNAALRADLSITKVRNHSFVSSYVEPSFDAMVNSGSSDLKFVNDGDTNIFIRSFGTETTAVVEIYGTSLPYKIVTKSVVTERNDPPPDTEIVDIEGKYIKEPLASGEKLRVSYGHGKLKSEGYLLYYSHAGRFIKKCQIRKDSYVEAAGIIAVAP